jgi:hypothetical protein
MADAPIVDGISLIVWNGDGAAIAQHLRQTRHEVELIAVELDGPATLGRVLQAGLPRCTLPLVATVDLSYPYTAADLDLLLKRLDQDVDVFGIVQKVQAVSGCRAGNPVPLLWRGVGTIYRVGMRIALGYLPPRLPGWLGLRNHVRSWAYWLLFGIPLYDLTSGLRVFRKEVFARIPIQTADDTAHVELFAKLTFVGTLLAEEVLPPRTAAIVPTTFGELNVVLKQAKFLPKAAEVADAESVPNAAADLL